MPPVLTIKQQGIHLFKTQGILEPEIYQYSNKVPVQVTYTDNTFEPLDKVWLISSSNTQEVHEIGAFDGIIYIPDSLLEQTGKIWLQLKGVDVEGEILMSSPVSLTVGESLPISRK